MTKLNKHFISLATSLISLSVVLAAPQGLSAGDHGSPSPDNYRRAAEYSRARNGDALVVMTNGELVFEDYAKGSGPDVPHNLASGTKTFWGVLAVAAAQDGLIDLDEKVAETITEWKKDTHKSNITVRQLLNFTSGLNPATNKLQGKPKSGDKFSQVLSIPTNAVPGENFSYGPSHLFAFGAFMKRKLAAAGKNSNPLEYLKQRVLQPIGMKVGNWAVDAAGNPIMPSGASVSPREWIKFGQLILQNGSWNGSQIIDQNYLREIFEGSHANPVYGLTIWLNKKTNGASGKDFKKKGVGNDEEIIYDNSIDVFMAAGKGKQRMYIIPSFKMVVVRLGNTKSGWENEDFLKILLFGLPSNDRKVSPTSINGNNNEYSGWRQVCSKDIERFCRESDGSLKALKRCFRKFQSQITPECYNIATDLIQHSKKN